MVRKRRVGLTETESKVSGVPTELSARRRWTVLAIYASALFLVGLDMASDRLP